MNGLFFGNDEHLSGENNIRLLAKCGSLEVMRQRIRAGATAWLVPAGTPEGLEFFHILSGHVLFVLDGKEHHLTAGQYFYVHELEKELSLCAVEDTVLLYVSNMPIFEDSYGFQKELLYRLRSIDEKDTYTMLHSRRVMRYSMLLREALEDQCTGTMEEMVIASLFHDVGKINVPDEVLKKKGRLTAPEYEIIKRHPADSAAILAGHFSDKIVSIARSHHERLNGSGYPDGLHADQLSMEMRIIAIADAFDAMTTTRGYNLVKSKQEAAMELLSLPELFDENVSRVLLSLVTAGQMELGPDILLEDAMPGSSV